MNLLALARLDRAIRSGHPSDAAAITDWDQRLLEHAPTVAAARDDAALIQALDHFVSGLGAPAVDIRLSNPPPPQPVPGLRRGPEVAVWRDVLYVALSPGDCCPSAIAEIEKAVADRDLSWWVLDLRHTAGRSFGSIYSEVKVTLDWLIEGPAKTPPRRGRGPAAPEPARPSSRSPDGFTDYGARIYAEGPGILAGLPVIVVIDETTHPGAGGWLLGLRYSNRGLLIGEPMDVQAEEPYLQKLSPTVEVAFPPTRYLDFDGRPRPDPRLMPDRHVELADRLPLAELLQRLEQAAGWGADN